MPTLAETTGTIFRFIEPQVQTKIFKRLNGVSKFKINGFTKIERAPLSVILNKCKMDQRSCWMVLESVVREYFGQQGIDDYVNDKNIPPSMTKDNGPGIMAIAALKEQDENYMEALFSKYETLLERKDEHESARETEKKSSFHWKKIIAKENLKKGFEWRRILALFKK